MALFDKSRPPVATLAAQPGPQHAGPPGPRELRAQAVHRLQIGLFGLAGMLLIVALANIIMNRAQLADAATAGTRAAINAGPSPSETAAKDPMVDYGVAPELQVEDPAPKSGAQ